MANSGDTNNRPSERLAWSWSWSGPGFSLVVGLVVALIVGSAAGLAVWWLPGLVGGSVFEVADFLKTRRGFGGAMLAFGSVGGLAGFGARALAVARGARPVRTPAWSWSGAGLALLAGVVVGLVFGSVLFGRLLWLQSQLGFAGSWERVFASVIAVVGGLVGGVAGFAAALGGLVRA